MKNKILISLLIVSFFNYIGCYSYESISYNEFDVELKRGESPKELFINTTNLKRYHCSGELFWAEQDSVKIKGTIVLNDYEEPYTGKFAIKDIESVEVKALDEGLTILFAGFVIGCTALLLMLSNFWNTNFGWSGT